eukprot:5846184-Prymnesium_polylepis.1
MRRALAERGRHGGARLCADVRPATSEKEKVPPAARRRNGAALSNSGVDGDAEGARGARAARRARTMRSFSSRSARAAPRRP